MPQEKVPYSVESVHQLEQAPSVASALALANKILTILGYVAYPVLLILLIVFEPHQLLRCIVVPAVGFVLVSAFRYLYNAPRPYEVYGFTPIIGKSTKGKSFPSRHTFCMFMIACTWLTYNIFCGIGLLLAGCAMGMIRVMCGVHFPKDVIAGALSAIVIAVIGYLVVFPG